MLAPLKNRLRLEFDGADPQADLSLPTNEDNASRIARLEAEVAALSAALRQSRQAQRRSATESAGKIMAQLNEINRLNALLAIQRERLKAFESGRAFIELGQSLQRALSTNDDESEHQPRLLENAIHRAQLECERLLREGESPKVFRQAVG